MTAPLVGAFCLGADGRLGGGQEPLRAGEDQAPEVTVLIPTWNSGRFLARCLAALERQTAPSFDVLIVDNGSSDGSLEAIVGCRLRPRALRLAENRGFAGAVAAGWTHCTSRWVALLNADTEPEPQWLEELLRAAKESEDPEAQIRKPETRKPETHLGAVASKMLSMQSPDLIDDAGDFLSWYGSATKRGHGEPAVSYAQDDEVLSASGGAALFSRAAVTSVGGFDERFESYFEDVDLGLRLRLAGYRCHYAAKARVLHYGGGSGLPRGRYVRLVTRNRLLAFGKSIPASLLLRHGGRLLWGQLYFFVAYRRPWQSIRGWLDLVLALPRLGRQRRAFAPLRTLRRDQIDRLLSRQLGEPPLRQLIWRRLVAKSASKLPGRP